MKWLSRAVGILIAMAVIGAATLLIFAVSSQNTLIQGPPTEGVFLGIWHVFYVTEAPSVPVMLAAVAIAILVVALVALLDRRAANKYRRSSNPRATPLAPKIVMAATRGVFAGPITVTVLIPAHNEEEMLPRTVPPLLAQSCPPDRVIVVADNCTDKTPEIARSLGLEVFATVGNSEKKGGALNQALKVFLPPNGDNDIIMVMDADTILDSGFIRVAVSRFANDRAVMAIGGLFYGEEGHGILGQFQRNEFVRYARELKRLRGRVFVLTGTASMFRPRALRTIAESRGDTIPGRPGDIYDTAALTEDNEITLAIKSLGGLMMSPAKCTVVTELMPSWRMLWRQRLRWQRGALENIGSYGMSFPLFRYWAQQLGIGYSVIALSSFMLLMALTVLATDVWIWYPFWLSLGAIFIVERVISVWRGGWKARILAATLFPELVFDLFLDAAYVKGIFDITFGRRANWGHAHDEIHAADHRHARDEHRHAHARGRRRPNDD